MPKLKESLYPPDWVKKAKKDLERVQKRLEDSDLEDAAFHLQQALEKYLKSYLLSRGWKLKRIHDLEELLDEATKHNPKFETFRKTCQKVTGYYLIDRYPFVTEAPPLKEIQTALREGEKIAKFILKEVGI
ncbi:MAG: HEPN domain-containing protein [Nitrospirota bacterium]